MFDLSVQLFLIVMLIVVTLLWQRDVGNLSGRVNLLRRQAAEDEQAIAQLQAIVQAKNEAIREFLDSHASKLRDALEINIDP